MINHLSIVTKQGKEIAEISQDLAQLRIAVFRDFPYLYEGSLEYEKDYLQVYEASENALVWAIYNQNGMVGATTALPLSHESSELQRPFLQAGLSIDSIFYFGESMLLKPYRGLGFGSKFFDVREAHARSFGTYQTACFCAVQRSEQHPLKPPRYRPNDNFWKRKGYEPLQGITCSMAWPDLGETNPTSKEMQFWSKSL
ncbi:MAG: GNAT family N-acetyltransferase [Cytophagales bacterium]|nr:MAG: GNAT family N-acetyltransferase [Cytophagales bacterium]TAF60405.1 MAG: GNAT family N-acetyltransferase [Cytophagales bacterium]